jgi:thioredoxin-like negative regulator of GroEL
MNVDLNKEISSTLGIRSIPTVKMFNEGNVVNTRVGVMAENNIKSLVKDLLLN